jgi:hypothetical protein
VWGLTQTGGKLTGQAELKLSGADALGGGGGSGCSVASFGEDAAGELYLLDLDGQVLRFES